MMQSAAGPPTLDGPSTTGRLGVKVTVPLALGGETANRLPAQAVPTRPVAMGSILKTGWPGMGRSSGVAQGSGLDTVLTPHDGFIRKLERVTGTAATAPREL